MTDPVAAVSTPPADVIVPPPAPTPPMDSAAAQIAQLEAEVAALNDRIGAEIVCPTCGTRCHVEP